MNEGIDDILELTWQPLPEHVGVEVGKLKRWPGLSLFYIEPDEDDARRFRLSGAVIPDAAERCDHLVTGASDDLKITAHLMMRAFLVRIIGGVFGGLDRPIAITDLKVITNKCDGERNTARVAFLVDNLLEKEL